MSSPYLDKEPRSELQARAEGHYAGKVKINSTAEIILRDDGKYLLASCGMTVGESRANAAYAYLAWTSHEALVNAVKNARGTVRILRTEFPEAPNHETLDAQTSAEIDRLDSLLAQIDAALSLASGKVTTVTADVVFTTPAFDAALSISRGGTDKKEGA